MLCRVCSAPVNRGGTAKQCDFRWTLHGTKLVYDGMPVANDEISVPSIHRAHELLAALLGPDPGKGITKTWLEPCSCEV